MKRGGYLWLLLGPGVFVGGALWSLIVGEYRSAGVLALMGLALIGLWCVASGVARRRLVPPAGS